MHKRRWKSTRNMPLLAIHIEPNKRQGHGYQMRVSMERVSENIIDSEPLSFGEVYIAGLYAIHQANEKYRASYGEECICLSDGVLKALGLPKNVTEEEYSEKVNSEINLALKNNPLLAEQVIK